VVPGVTEVAAFFLYAWGARSDIAIAAVPSSTFGALQESSGSWYWVSG
jgi:hypothetical protein